MDGFGFAGRCLELFGFEVDGMPDFVEAAILQAAIACDLGCDLEFLTVRIGINARVEMRGSSAEMKSHTATLHHSAGRHR